MAPFFSQGGKAVLECLLFVASQPLSAATLAEVADMPPEDVHLLLRELAEDYAARGSGLQLEEVGGGYRLVTRPEYASYVEKLYRPRPGGLSPAALETLAVIAYRQPLTRAEIEQVRGVKVDGVLANLLERGLIREVGRKEAPGRPILYGTTEEFLHHFGLRDLGELPPLGGGAAAPAAGSGQAV